MELFKERLKIFGKNVITWAILLAGALLVAWLIVQIPVIVANIISVILGLIIFLALIFVIGGVIWKGIHWLFIEPFRRKK